MAHLLGLPHRDHGVDRPRPTHHGAGLVLWTDGADLGFSAVVLQDNAVGFAAGFDFSEVESHWTIAARSKVASHKVEQLQSRIRRGEGGASVSYFVLLISSA